MPIESEIDQIKMQIAKLQEELALLENCLEETDG